MRRKERECSDKAFLSGLLQKAAVMTIAFQSEEFPYVIPVNFVLVHNAVYFHCAREGRKLDCLKKKPEVGFSVHELLGIDQENATTFYNCLYGEGHAFLVQDRDEKQTALAALAEKYQSRCPLPVPEPLLEKTAVVRIDIVSMSGKRHLPPLRQN